ncbi:hypothetical protein ABZP36_028341 [Zizania latifolia]
MTISDKKGCRLVKLLAEAREMAISLLESTSRLLSKQTEMPKWPLVSKTFQKRKVVCAHRRNCRNWISQSKILSGAELLFMRFRQPELQHPVPYKLYGDKGYVNSHVPRAQCPSEMDLALPRYSSTNMACHLRSVSLPSKRHSNEAEIEGELQSLEASISPPCTTIDAMSNGLRSLGDVYNHIEEIIHMPSNQVCSAQQRKMLEVEMECSLGLIDLCSAMQENFTGLKTIIQDLQVVLRRGDFASIQVKIQSFTRLAKKAQKQCKKISKKTASYKEDCKLVRLLIKARMVTVSLLKSTLCHLSQQLVVPKRSLVSKAFQKKRSVVCEEEQLQLQALECIIGDLEHGAEILFRRMIQSRVALLNTLSS